MPLLVTSASAVNGNGFGELLAFELEVKLRGTFIDDERIVDPRGLAVDPKENLLFLNSRADRVLAISPQGRIIRDTGRIEGLDPGGGTFGPHGRYYVGSRAVREDLTIASSVIAAIVTLNRIQRKICAHISHSWLHLLSIPSRDDP